MQMYNSGMGFIGIFFIGIAAVAIFFLILGAILFVFIPCLIIAIINLVKGIKNHWPKRNLIPLIITGTIDILFILLIMMYLSWRFSPEVVERLASSSEDMQASIYATLPLLM